eukprot:Pgem_evm1s16089
MHNLTNRNFTKAEFEQLVLPAVVSMYTNNSCVDESVHGSTPHSEPPSSAEIWGYSM